MHPISTLLLILGYALAMPIAVRLASVRPRLVGLAIGGYQVGVIVAGLGWLLRGFRLVALAHLVWALLLPWVYRRRLRARLGTRDE